MASKKKKYSLEFKLSVVRFAEQNSGEAAARHFSVDPKRVREWRKAKGEMLSEGESSRARLRGGGRKKASEEMEEQLCNWIRSMRAKHLRVSRKMIRTKAKEIYGNVSDSRNEENFTASAGWLYRFLKRNDSTTRRRATVAQKNSRHFTEKLVNFITYTGRIIETIRIQPENIIAMDETVVYFDTVGSATVDVRGACSVPLKTNGQEKCHLTVVMSAKADGTKLKPYVVFKGDIKEVKEMQNFNGVVVAASKNGWMNEELTADWLRRVLGKRNFAPRLLAWDSHRCHTSEATKAELKRGYNVAMAVIPGGCSEYIQAPDVVWNQPFKASLQESFDNWMAGDGDKEYTAAGNMRAPALELLVLWVLQAWEKLDTELVKNSFKVCGLTVASDGSEDHLIHCFKKGEPCASGMELLAQARKRESEASAAVWLAALRETDKPDSLVQKQICEDHFLPEDITHKGVSPDAIPIMPPCLDGPLGMSDPWGAESSEEEDQWATGYGDCDDDDDDDDDEGQDDDVAAEEPPAPPVFLLKQEPVAKKISGSTPTSVSLHQVKEAILTTKVNKQRPLGKLTQRFLELFEAAPDGSLDLRSVAASLSTNKQRVCDITDVLYGINLIERQSENRIKWIGRSPVSSFLSKKHKREQEDLKLVEDTLDTLIKSCSEQLFDITNDRKNSALAYITHQDINRLKTFQEQTVIVVKAPEETELKIPSPKEDSIQVHMKSDLGPIMVLTCEVGTGSEKSSRFGTLEESRMQTSTLHTESWSLPSAAS